MVNIVPRNSEPFENHDSVNESDEFVKKNLEMTAEYIKKNLKSATLSWHPHENDTLPILGYMIERKAGQSDWDILVEDTKNNQTTYTDNNLFPGVLYDYRISIIGEHEITEPSNVKKTSFSKDHIIINWPIPTLHGTDVSFFILEKKIGDDEFRILTEVPPNYSTYVDTSITFGKIYQYRLTAVFENGFNKTGSTITYLMPSDIIEK